MVALLLIIGSVTAAMLGVINVYTAPIVAHNRETKLKKKVLDVFDIPYTNENLDEVFKKAVKTKIEEDAVQYELYSKDKGGEKLTAIAFEVGGPGFWAHISAIVAFEPDHETIKALKILSQTETPGLGDRIIEPEFQDQFKGKKIKPYLTIVAYRKAAGTNEVDAITGATMTSKALENIINKETKIFFEKVSKR